MSDTEDGDLFAQMMRDVTPLSPEARVQVQSLLPPVKAAASTPVPVRKQRNTRQAPKEMDDGCLCASGVSPKQLQRLRSGQMSAEQTLDLHGKTQHASTMTLEAALQQSLEHGVRVLRIIHGRGLHSPDGQGVLKRLTYDWLQHGSMKGFVLAVVPCPQGGSGACLVLLRRDKR